MATIFERIKPLVVEQLGAEEADVVPTASFVEDLGADSLDLVEFVMQLEERFDIKIPDDDVEKIQTIADAISYIQERTRK